MTLQVKRTAVNCYTLITDTVLSDGSLRKDTCMILDGNVLRSLEMPGFIRHDVLLRLNLGPVSLAKVEALSIGESVSF